MVRRQLDRDTLSANPARDELLALWDEAMAAFIAGESTELDPALPQGAHSLWAALVAPANQPFMADFMAARPADLLAATTAPVLVIIGRKDVQSDWQLDGAALKAAAGVNATFNYPTNANHALKLEEKPVEELTMADSATYNAAGRVLDPETVQVILDWLGEQIN